jgi:hypothetical protein
LETMDVILQTGQNAQEDVQGAVHPLQSVNLLSTNDTSDGSPKAELEKTLSHIPAMASQNTMQTVSQDRSENLDNPNGGTCMEMFQPTDQLHVPTNRKTPVSSISTAWSRGGLAVCVWGPFSFSAFNMAKLSNSRTHALNQYAE